MKFRATGKQALQSLGAGLLCGALTYLFFRLLGGVPEKDLSITKILLVCLAGPILEEIVFRGLAFWPAQQYLGDKIAIPLCAALFGLAHWGFSSSLLAFAAGLLFGYLRAKTDSILCPMLAHMAANGVLVILQATV